MGPVTRSLSFITERLRYGPTMQAKNTTPKANAIITGASKRIGRAIALSLAESGYGVVVHYNSSRGDAIRLCREIEENRVPAWPIRADLGKPSEAEGLIERALDQSGALSVLVNNASIFPPATLDDVTYKDL